MRLVSLTLGLAFATLAPVAFAEPRLEHVEPPSVARGQQNQLTMVGSGVDRASGIWTSLPADKFKVATVVSSEPERSEFKIDVAADCPLGVYGLRLATEDGLSNLHLFVVDDLAPRTELANPQAEFPVAVAGQLRSAQVDRYPIQVSAGQRLAFEVVASRLGNDADPLLTIYDSTGKRVLQRDNDPGLFFDCSCEHTFERAGIYTVEVRDARFLGSPHWRYLLRIGNFPVARVALPSAVRPGESAVLRFPEVAGPSVQFDVPANQPPGGFFYALRRPGDTASSWLPLLSTPLPSVIETEPNDLLEQATPVPSAPLVLHGNFEQPGDKDYFALDLKKGDKLAIRAETRPLNSAADVELILLDTNGKEMQRVDDQTLPGGALDEGQLNVNIGQDGIYGLLVRELNKASGPEFTYRVTMQPVLPRIQIVAEVSAFAIPQAGFQVLPLTVTRSEFSGPIELSLVGAPPGLQLEPAVIPEGENSLVCKLLATTATPLGLYSLQIVGKGQMGETSVTTVVTSQPLVDRQQINVDLIKHALRDNQRWLPPSVTDKFALQVTPPAPFAIDLAESKVILPRYQQADLQIQTTRSGGFDGAITFVALGGQQLGEETQGRRQVFARFPTALPDQPVVTATIHSRSQANEGTERVDITAEGKLGSRSIQFKRCITLVIKPAFEIEVEPAKLTLLPGEKATVKLLAQRLPSFAGAVTIDLSTVLGIATPSSLTIAADQSAAQFEVAIPADSKSRRERIRFVATAPVNGFQEEPRAKELEIEIKEPPKDK